ncbi:hypothetical protein [Uliginosibacterium sp. 31-12]|uniref:MinD/ParA family ATP-binding protein n=1 Tax=Uliginosibacterium sp. 31-12 TaxID=3062781 RepID=UPI0026E33DD1|nr:hypothetical protein [Uliginosibacterium sp. 31-12]MDO6388036.1 hypothetical protein [Uliginosibacterium sp. 31-12]
MNDIMQRAARVSRQVDQADGLRRLLHAAPPEVLAVLPCGGGASRWLAAQLRVRAESGLRLLVLEERLAAGNMGDCLGRNPRFDLRMAVEGLMPASSCLVEAQPGLEIAQVAALVEQLGSERIFNQRAIEQLRGLRAGHDEWVIVAQPAELRSLSALAFAAPRLLLLLDAQPMSITTAYASLKRLCQAGGERHVSVCFTQPPGPREQGLLMSFCETALNRLELPLQPVSSLGEALRERARETGESADAFIERLVQTTSGATRLHGRGPGRV